MGDKKVLNKIIMSTKSKKRITKQIRVSEKAHKILKLLAKEAEMTMSKMADDIILSSPLANQIDEKAK